MITDHWSAILKWNCNKGGGIWVAHYIFVACLNYTAERQVGTISAFKDKQQKSNTHYGQRSITQETQTHSINMGIIWIWTAYDKDGKTGVEITDFFHIAFGPI